MSPLNIPTAEMLLLAKALASMANPARPHTYLLDMSHNAGLGLDVQLFDSLNEFLFSLTL